MEVIRSNKLKNILFEKCNNEISFSRKVYYYLKPLIPRVLQIYLRYRKAKRIKNEYYEESQLIQGEILRDILKEKSMYFIWFWPKNYRTAVVITHDVESKEGYKRVLDLVEIDERFGFKSCFGFIPERYPIDKGILKELKTRGFEIAVHGLRHDGKLFNSPKIFKKRLRKIEEYAKEWEAEGFRSPSLLRNARWMSCFKFLWDSSFPDWDVYGPQPGGCRTVFPFFISQKTIELPVTLMQDHTLFEILKEEDIRIWKKKTKYIIRLNGLINIVIHPDYIFQNKRVTHYQKYLDYLRSQDGIWWTLPRDIAKWWRKRERSKVQFDSKGNPVIEGPAKDNGIVALTEFFYQTVSFKFYGE